MHQVVISTADKFNGADLGIRETWVPLFDKYGVDLVVCGHEHHYERSHPIRGQQPTDTRIPIPVATDTDTIDTTQGTVHMVIGGGGTSAPSNHLFFSPAKARVIAGVGAVDPATGKRPPLYVIEDAPWSAFRDADNPYGFAAFEVDPGERGGNRQHHHRRHLLLRQRALRRPRPRRPLHPHPPPRHQGRRPRALTHRTRGTRPPGPTAPAGCTRCASPTGGGGRPSGSRRGRQPGPSGRPGRCRPSRGGAAGACGLGGGSRRRS